MVTKQINGQKLHKEGSIVKAHTPVKNRRWRVPVPYIHPNILSLLNTLSSAVRTGLTRCGLRRDLDRCPEEHGQGTLEIIMESEKAREEKNGS